MNIKELDHLIKKMINDKFTPGAVLSININNKNEYFKSFGCFTYKNNSPKIELDTLYDIASITKQITATGLLILTDKKK